MRYVLLANDEEDVIVSACCRSAAKTKVEALVGDRPFSLLRKFDRKSTSFVSAMLKRISSDTDCRVSVKQLAWLDKLHLRYVVLPEQCLEEIEQEMKKTSLSYSTVAPLVVSRRGCRPSGKRR